MNLRETIDSVRGDGRPRMVTCPAHEDLKASVSVSLGDEDRILLHDHGGCETEAVLSAAGLDWAALFKDNGNGGGYKKIVARYPYTDEDGELLYEVVRYAPKDFRQRCPDGSGGWLWKLDGVRRVVYGLPALLEATDVFIVEGEADADVLIGLGFVATCNAGGAEKWRKEYAEAFTDRQHVVIVPDNDDVGRKHAQQVAESLAGVVASVKVLDLPVSEKGDVSDFIAAQPDEETAKERLAVMAEEAEEWQPQDLQPADDGRDLTHDGLALELGECWKDSARHVAAWGQWLFWSGSHWRKDNSLEHMTQAREFLRAKAHELEAEAAEATDEKMCEALTRQAKALRNAHTVAQVVGLARSNETQAATVEQWDADPWLLGTPDGTVDLRAGELRPALPGDYITKIAAVCPAAIGTPTPLWTKFLKRITENNDELIAYLQRFVGYALTGSIEEHAFAFGHGVGANGKGVFVGAVQGVLGDYAVTIPTEMLMVAQSERHPTELARLRGVRLAIGSEVEVGKRWAEARVKSLTGGDRIAARLMRQDYFEFAPKFKLLVIGNHRPSLRGVDDAIRRRLHLVPFEVRIPTKEQDPKLPEKLRKEWPGILRWAIEGCCEWQRRGLDPPDSVTAATDSYLEGEDAFGNWLQECTREDANAWTPSADLFASWKCWAEVRGEFVGSQKRLGHELQDRGFTPDRQAGKRGYRGLWLKKDAS